MTQRIDRKTFEVDVDYSLLNEQTNAEIKNIKSGLHNPAADKPNSGWWTNRWMPYAALAACSLILLALMFGFWHLQTKIDVAAASAKMLNQSNEELLTKHVTKEHLTTRALLNSLAAMIVELDSKKPEANGNTSIEPTGPDWEQKYEDLNSRYENIKAELDIANGKIANIAGLPKTLQATIKRSVVVFNSRPVDGKDVVTGWNFDSVTAIKPSSEFCYLSVFSGQENISLRFDIMRDRQKVNFPNPDMRKYGVSQAQLDRARSACTWHTGKGA